MALHRGLIVPSAPAIHLRDPGPLCAGFRTNWQNVNQAHGKTRFRIRAYYPDLPYVKRVLDPLCKHWIDDPEDAWEFWERINSGDGPSWFPGISDYPGLHCAVDSVTFLTSSPGSNTTYSTPVDWNNAANHIECIGGGAGGTPGAAASTNVGNGGGGGGYSRADTITLSGTINRTVGVGGGSNTNGGDTFFNATVFASASVGAKGGNIGAAAGTATGGVGGASSSGIGSTKYSGGTGSTGYLGSGPPYTGGGGAGAAGPNGNGGGAGSSAGGGSGNGGGSAAPTGFNGGNNSSASGGGTTTIGGITAQASNGGGGPGGFFDGTQPGAGSTGTEWDASHGSGGGGGGGVDNGSIGPGANGGNYGAAGGGGGNKAGAGYAGGSGTQGLIVVTYTPNVANRMFAVF